MILLYARYQGYYSSTCCIFFIVDVKKKQVPEAGNPIAPIIFSSVPISPSGALPDDESPPELRFPKASRNKWRHCIPRKFIVFSHSTNLFDEGVMIYLRNLEIEGEPTVGNQETTQD